MDGTAPVSSNQNPHQPRFHVNMINTASKQHGKRQVLTSSSIGVSLILSIWMSCSVLLWRLSHVMFLVCTSSCCPSVKQLSSQLSISFHHSLLSSSDADKKQLCRRGVPLLLTTQIIRQGMWFYMWDIHGDVLWFVNLVVVCRRFLCFPCSTCLQGQRLGNRKQGLASQGRHIAFACTLLHCIE